MPMFLQHYKTAWKDYFSGTAPTTTLNSQEYTSRPTTSSTYVHVLDCLFRSITSTNYGGALYCSTSVAYLLVESTSFFSCKVSYGNGGAIYFYNTNNGQCVLYEVCGHDCCTTTSNSALFVYLFVKNDILSKNFVNYSSITRCVNTNAWETLWLNNGKVFCPSINLSNNNCLGQFVLCFPLKYSNSVTCSFSYSSFADNFANKHMCFNLATTGAEYEIKTCNILRNTQDDFNSLGIILTYGNLKIADACILENKANCTFYQYSSYTITLSSCTVDSTSNNGYLTIQNTVTKSIILALDHMYTRNCHSEYDAAGTLTPIIQFSNRQKCYTNQKYRLQLRDEDAISLISILVFNFIHLQYSNVHLYQTDLFL
jgi:hypothetical protein